MNEVKRATVIAGAVLVALSAWSCGSAKSEDSGEAEGGDQERIILDPSVGRGSFFGGRDENGECIGLRVQDDCPGEVYAGESIPLDLYLMFDQSGSMSIVVDEADGTTRMDVVRQAVESFVEDEESVGIGAGIGYFGHQPLGSTSCSPDDYEAASVSIDVLPAQGAEVLASLDAREPTGETPTGAAIRGACRYASEHKSKSPGRSTAVLLVTDGEPKAPLSQATCEPTLADAVVAAQECYEDTGVRIYVLGVGPSLTNLNQIAAAGGTERAYLADQDNAEQVLGALRAVRGAAQIPCELELITEVTGSDRAAFGSSTVAYLDGECSYIPITQVEDRAGCDPDEGGWYFDDAGAPEKIHLCQRTCGDVKSYGMELFYSIGCQVVVR